MPMDARLEIQGGAIQIASRHTSSKLVGMGIREVVARSTAPRRPRDNRDGGMRLHSPPRISEPAKQETSPYCLDIEILLHAVGLRTTIPPLLHYRLAYARLPVS